MEAILCSGFMAAGVASGLKKRGQKDLGLIFSQVPAKVAGVFTRNRVQAAPVRLDKERIASGTCQAIIANSGNANCCTGEKGVRDARAMAGFAASELGINEDLVLVASTGVIGEPLPLEKIESSVPGLVRALEPEGISEFARAILTTDTVPKTISRQGNLEGKPFTVFGVAKGAGMIRPDMATMLCFVCTDIDADPDLLRDSLYIATQRSFNRISIDGDTSTNDTVLILANGLSGAVITSQDHKDLFQDVLNDVLMRLAEMIVKDGEGASKLVEITVKGAVSDKDAFKVVDAVAHSNLVKTAFFGEDANWGRIIAAAGRANVPIEPDSIDIFFDDVMVVKDSTGCGKAAEAEATKVLKQPEFKIYIDLKMGSGSASILTCDFSVDYVKINADYRS
jgi:glutamate N-acetyltransferase/amino-acid N-acetyltransferase